MTPLQSNVLKLVAALSGFGLLAWMDWAGVSDPDLKLLIYQALTGLGIIHVVNGSSPK